MSADTSPPALTCSRNADDQSNLISIRLNFGSAGMCIRVFMLPTSNCHRPALSRYAETGSRLATTSSRCWLLSTAPAAPATYGIDAPVSPGDSRASARAADRFQGFRLCCPQNSRSYNILQGVPAAASAMGLCRLT